MNTEILRRENPVSSQLSVKNAIAGGSEVAVTRGATMFMARWAIRVPHRHIQARSYPLNRGIRLSSKPGSVSMAQR